MSRLYSHDSPPQLGRMPDLDGATSWLNTDPLTRDDLLNLIRDAGFTPKERNTRYEVIREYDRPVPLAQRRAEPQAIWA